jgi:hypothetical protein
MTGATVDPVTGVDPTTGVVPIVAKVGAVSLTIVNKKVELPPLCPSG